MSVKCPVFIGGVPVFAAIMLAAGQACAQQDAFWVNPVSGLWSDAANWSVSFVPGQGANTNVRAVVDRDGPYTVALDFNAQVAGLELSGVGATLALTAPGTTLVSNGINTFEGASVTGDLSTVIQTRGTTTFTAGASFNRIGRVDLGGRTEFTDDDIDLCDTCVFLTGPGFWTGGGTFTLQNDGVGSELVIEQGGSLRLEGAGSRTIQGIGGNNRFVNLGQLRLDFDSGAETLEISGAAFQNAAGGRVSVRTGTLRSNLSGTLSGTSLRGGDWFVGSGGTVDALGSVITAIDAKVELSGAAASFAALNTLERITANGAFRVTEGKAFQTDAGLAPLDVQGELEVGAGSVITVTGGLANLQAGTLTGGSFVVGGSLALSQGGPIEAIEASLTLAGAGAVGDGTGADFLATLAEIRSGGVLALREGASFTTAGDLALTGTLDIGRGSVADVRGDLGAFQAGVLGKAGLRVGGDLVADNSRIETIAGSLVVGLDGRILARDGAGGTVDGLAFLGEIRAGGSLELAGGRDLDLRSASNTVAIAGDLILGATGSGDADPLLGSVLSAGAVTFADGSSLTTSIAAIDNFGRIVADNVAFGSGASGETAGTLIVRVGEGYTGSFGDRFLVVGASDVFGDGFETLVVDGALADGLFFELFLDGTGVGVAVVPAPAGLALLGAGVLASRRRRS